MIDVTVGDLVDEIDVGTLVTGLSVAFFVVGSNVGKIAGSNDGR